MYREIARLVASPKFPLSMSEKWLIIQGIGPTVTVAYWVH
jgi:hypothetical protein